MRAFLKNLLRLAGGAIAVGILLVVIAFSMDNRVFTKWHNVDYDIGDGWRLWNGVDSGREDTANAEDTDEASAVSDDSHVLTYEKIKSLDFSMFAGKLHIEEGKEFTLKVNEEGGKRVSSEVTDGVWTLKEKSIREKNSGGENNITIFGVDINLDNTAHRRDLTEVYITIPKNFTADKISLSVGAGTITAESLSANSGSISVGAGTCSIEELNVKDRSSYQVDAGMLKINNAIINDGTMTCAAGKIEIEDGTIHNSTISCTAGAIDIKGSITGDSDIRTSVGSINLRLDGKEEDYNYTIDCNLGSLKLNGTKYSGINKHIVQKNSAPNNMALNCDIGSISMNID